MKNEQTPAAAPTPVAGAPRRMNWVRFWIQMGIAMLVFNIVAAFITAVFILPHLHPPK